MCNEILRSRFITVPITNTPLHGVKIGDGECKGVRLFLNPFTRNSAALANTPFYCYYGDAKSQERQLIAVDTLGNVKERGSPLIPCTNLNEVFIRYRAIGGWPATAHVQVQIIY